MHFDGETEQLCKVTRQRLKKCLECRSKWAKLNCQQAEIAKKSYENIDDGSVTSYMEKNPDSINLEWFHHMKCWKTFCDEGKIRRQQRNEKRAKELAVKGKGPTSTEVSPEAATDATLPQRNAQPRASRDMCILFVGETLLSLVFIRQGRGTLIGIYTVILALYGHVDNIAMSIQHCYY